MTMIDTPSGMEFFKLAQVCGRLKIEVELNLRFRQSSLQPAKNYYNLKVSKKKAALDILDDARARVLAGENIWLVLAEVRGSEVFIFCDACEWQGDMFTVGTNDDAWHCPKCKADESALVSSKLEDAKRNWKEMA